MTNFIIAGVIGGVLRGAMGVVKYSLSYKDVTIRPWYFALMVALTGAIGGAVAWAVNNLGLAFLGVEKISSALALVIGYAAGDFFENLFKIITRQPNLFQRLPDGQ